jgi:thiol-disulfide isomerase/thioredoxin
MTRLGTARPGRSVHEPRPVCAGRAGAALVLAALLALAGCSTSKDAVATGGTFQFVAPGGKTELTYDPPSTRGTVGPVSGPSLADPTRTLQLADYAGKVVVLNVWGSWCGPCRAEAPNLQFVARQEGTRGVAVVGVDVRDDRQAALDFARSAGITYDSISDYPGRSLAGLGGVPRNVVPLTVVLDKQHRVAYVSLVSVQVAKLVSLVQRLAAE